MFATKPVCNAAWAVHALRSDQYYLGCGGCGLTRNSFIFNLTLLVSCGWYSETFFVLFILFWLDWISGLETVNIKLNQIQFRLPAELNLVFTITNINVRNVLSYIWFIAIQMYWLSIVDQLGPS